MPSSRYSIVEPHPSTTSSSYIATGRGGAGNIKRAPPSVTRGSDAYGPASLCSSLNSPSSGKRVFMSGRGGAGNAHHPSERAIFSFDEELASQMARERSAAPVYHVGRGGAGNVYGKEMRDERSVTRKASNDSDSQKSDSSVRSAESGADVATRGLLKGWKKITGVH